MEKGQEKPAMPISSSGSCPIPAVGMGLAVEALNPTEFKAAMMEAIKIGYRHFDTASLYQSEQVLGEALAEAIQLGLVTREELFITSKLWCIDAHPHLVAPALLNSLRTLQLQYLDLYLIHWPISAKPSEKPVFPMDKEDLLPMDYKGVWQAMEECQTQGLTKSIGVSNFSCKKLGHILSFATIIPLVNQVEMSPVWQQRNLRDFCVANGVNIMAYAPFGAKGTPWGTNAVMENETLIEIAKARNKSVAQVCLRWVHEQGVSFVVKSFNKERMKQNLEIFDWALTEEDYDKINNIPQQRLMPKLTFVTPRGPFKSLQELWDGEL